VRIFFLVSQVAPHSIVAAEKLIMRHVVFTRQRAAFGVFHSALSAMFFVVALSVSTSTRADYVSVSIESETNADIRTYTQGGNYPAAPTNISVAGVPFQLVPLVTAPGNPNTLGVIQAPGGNSSFVINTDVPGATTVYTLMNSEFGQSGSDIGSIEFIGALGSDAVFQIVEGTNIRDHFDGGFNNSATNIVPDTFLNGSQDPSGPDRLDMQTFVLPSSFASDTLTTIIFSGANAGSPQGQPFLAAATAAVPEPASLTLVGLGAAAVFARGVRRRKVARAKSF
jgi:hypothetical protein